MSEYVQAVATEVPATVRRQSEALAFMRAWIGGDRRTDRLLERVYAHSGIEHRHTVLREFEDGQGPGLYRDADGAFRNPGTDERNARYRREAGDLFGRVATRVLSETDGVDPAEVTHLITVSCTGFYAPGPDVDVVHAAGLSPGVERYHLGFMGCYGAFPALRMAQAFCRADPQAVVLIVAVELCSLHLQPDRDVDAVLAASLFADGAAAAVVSTRPPRRPALELGRFHDRIVPEGADAMAWTLGDHGFRMVLARTVPGLVAGAVRDVFRDLEPDGRDGSAPEPLWAVHPGGRAILDAVEAHAGPCALAASRGVLRAFGNMSSASVLFVLQRLLDGDAAPGTPVLALAFGPGLTVAAGRMRIA